MFVAHPNYCFCFGLSLSLLQCRAMFLHILFDRFFCFDRKRYKLADFLFDLFFKILHTKRLQKFVIQI